MRNVTQKPLFRRVYKKLAANQLPEVNTAIRAIASNPEIGKEKRADLAGVLVYKFSVVDQQYLLSYTLANIGDIELLAIGVHENFSRDLKRNIH